MRFADVRRRVRAALGQEHRYAHVVRTARFAETLAHVHGESTQRARLAGMLHDLARLWPAKKLLAESERRGIPIGAFERAHPIVLHAPLGAELARERFDIADEAILSAIRKHTVGAGEMSRLDIIIYLADALEPGRDYAERAAFAALALRDLDAALNAVLASSVASLRDRGFAVAPQTLAALERRNSPCLP